MSRCSRRRTEGSAPKRLLEDGKYRPAGENADAETIRSFVNRLLRLTSPAADIVEAISAAGSRRGCSWRT
jgi:hypothetical protein